MTKDENSKRLIEIDKANNLVTEMKHEVDKYTKLLELAKADQVNTVIHNVNYFQILFRAESAMTYLSANPEMDKRTKEYKESKMMFESLQKYLEDEVFKRSIKITKMYSGGYENYYYGIVFTVPYLDTEFTFTVPNPEVINVRNFEYAYEGKLAFGYYKGDHCCMIEKTSYCIEDVTKAFEDLIAIMSKGNKE